MDQQPDDDSAPAPPRVPSHSTPSGPLPDRPPTSPAPSNFLLVSDRSGLFLTPDNERIMTVHQRITTERPRGFVQSATGSHLAVYLNDHVHLLTASATGDFGPVEFSTAGVTSNSSAPPLKVDQLVEMYFTASDLVLRTPRRLLVQNLATGQLTASHEIRVRRPLEISRDCRVYSVGDEPHTSRIHYQTLLSYHIFSTHYQGDSSPAPGQPPHRPIDNLLLRSVELQEEPLKDRLVFRGRNQAFSRSQTHCIFFLPDDRLIDVSLENNVVAFFGASDNTFKPFELPDDEFSAFEASANPKGDAFLLVFTQLFFGPKKTERGNQKVFLADADHESVRRVQTVSGPVYAAKWSHTGHHFAVLSGVAPSYLIIYDKSGEPQTRLGRLYANRVEWSPNSQLLAVGGFGTLDNEVTIYRFIKDFVWEVACIVPVKGATEFGFFRDSGRFWLSLTHSQTTEKNRFQIHGLNGEVLYKADYDPNPLFSFEESRASELSRRDGALRKPVPESVGAGSAEATGQLQDFRRN